MEKHDNIIPINIEDEMKTAYIDYSMSVIVSRAIPDVRDGLKPVHRRVLFGMNDLGLSSSKPYKKSARIVGEVLGKYHPHGDSSVYDAMVRMAQPWSLRYPLVDGQGNFGSVDGDSPAAMRYTEARYKKMAEEMLSDIDKDTVDFSLNFDDTLKEPTVLPSRIPTLLINGASGIAVGMATNILPHNLSEVIDGTIAYIADNEIGIDGLMQYIKAPDFPTGGTIYGYSGVKESFETGRGRIVLRGKARIETDKRDRERIIITEIPYQVNKAMMIKKAADLVNEKRIEGISDIRDESDRNGMRVVVELKRDAVANVVLNKLYNYTPLQSSYGVNNVALVKGRPMILNLKDFITNFVEFRHEVVVRRTKFELAEAERKAHILEGLLIALDNIDEVIALIRASKDGETARNGLIDKFGLTEIQAKAVLDMRLQKLTGLESDKLRQDHAELMELIKHLNTILGDEDMRMEIIKEELIEIKEKYGDERKTDIEIGGADINIEDLIPDEEVAITISRMGYIKRTPLVEYKAQNRGGKGSRGSSTRNEDFIEHLLVATTHNYMLFFTEMGKCFWLKVYQIPEGSKTSKGRAIQNVINLPKDDKVLAYIPIKDLKDEEFLNSHFLVFCTKQGIVKKTSIEAYSRPRSNGVNAITIKDGDQLLGVKLTNGNCEVLIATKAGRAIRFNENPDNGGLRSMGRNAAGVRGVRLKDDKDEVVGLVCVDKEDDTKTILVVSERGYGKRTRLDDEDGEAVYRVTNRGGKGVKTMSVTEKTGNLIALKDVEETDGIMIINTSGITIRLSLENVRTMGRATQGVRLITLNEGDEIAAVAKIDGGGIEDEDTENEETGEDTENGEETTNEETQE